MAMKGVLNISQSSKTGASPSDAVLCHILDTRRSKVLNLCRDAVDVFYGSRQTDCLLSEFYIR